MTTEQGMSYNIPSKERGFDSSEVQKEIRGVAFFDVDGTLSPKTASGAYNTTGFLEFITDNEFVSPNSLLKDRQDWVDYRAGVIDYKEISDRVVANLALALTGRDVAEVEKWQEAYVAQGDRVFGWVPEAMKKLKDAGYEVYAISGAGDPGVRRIIKSMGIDDDHISTSPYEIVDGKYTGKVEGMLNFDAKQARVEEIMKKHPGVPTLAVGDSDGDFAMLNSVDTGILYEAKPQYQSDAHDNGWHTVNRDTILQTLDTVVRKPKEIVREQKNLEDIIPDHAVAVLNQISRGDRIFATDMDRCLWNSDTDIEEQAIYMGLVSTERQAAWLQALSDSENGDSALVEERFITQKFYAKEITPELSALTGLEIGTTMGPETFFAIGQAVGRKIVAEKRYRQPALDVLARLQRNDVKPLVITASPIELSRGVLSVVCSELGFAEPFTAVGTEYEYHPDGTFSESYHMMGRNKLETVRACVRRGAMIFGGAGDKPEGSDHFIFDTRYPVIAGKDDSGWTNYNEQVLDNFFPENHYEIQEKVV